MLTIEIKANDQLIEVITVQNKGAQKFNHDNSETGYHKYKVNTVYDILHKREDGHRELARLALNALKKGKK